MERDLAQEIHDYIESSNELKQKIIAYIDYHMFVAKMNEADDPCDILDSILFTMDKTADDLIIADEHELIDLIYSKMDWLG